MLDCLYILSISFQITGSIILLLWCFNLVKAEQIKTKIIERYFPGCGVPIVNNDGNCSISVEKVQEIVRELYLNFFALSSLLIGYILSVFANVSLSRFVVLIFIIETTIFLIWCEWAVAEIMSKLNYPEGIKISAKDLRKNSVGAFISVQ